MSFRVECSPGFCGPYCTTLQNNVRVAECRADGTLTCNDNFDPTTKCTSCLPNRDPSTNCTQCLPGWDITSDCTSCLPNFDPNTNCSECIGNRDLSSSCSTCLPGYDSISDCAVCLSGRNISTRCTTCLSGFSGSNCEPGECMPGRIQKYMKGGDMTRSPTHFLASCYRYT